ncbi:class I SAM-dependent methyltransferase [Fluviibacterium sp. DFM31]|uniref:Class I SAM-dependent methyltransferase n=1 Tax=Meridianimarinicoccus marinus TaxID=3231483 RepID=A0ABV3L6N3_9RHOB
MPDTFNIPDKISSQIVTNHFRKCPAAIGARINDICPSPATIVDFGCGLGIKTVAIAAAFPEANVIGVDITQAHQRAREFCDTHFDGRMPQNLSFHTIEPGTSIGSICTPDVIYSWSVMEHIQRDLLPGIIADMYKALAPEGMVFTQIAPLFHSPFGHHLREFCDIPWIHLQESHQRFRRRISDVPQREGATGSAVWMFSRFEDLNRITADELAGYFDAAGFACAVDDRKKTPQKPPAELAATYHEAALRTFELLFVHRKTADRSADAPEKAPANDKGRKWWNLRG